MADPDPATTDVPGAADSPETTDRLVGRFYDELRRIAAGMGRELPAGATLQPTALVHEAYLRLARGKDPRWESRRHFFGAAARAMREVVIEQYRRRECVKRGGGLSRVPLEDMELTIEPPSEDPPSGDLLALDEAIARLDRQDPRLGEVVRLRYFAGLTIEETAEVLGESTAKIKRDWRFIRAWLASELDAGPVEGDGR